MKRCAAPNTDELAAEVEKQTGFPLRVLSEEAEAEFSFLGATTTSAPDGYGPVAVADVGGGSSELAVGRCGEKPSWWHSIELGTAHLVRESIGDVEERLDTRRFLRIHRGTIVNVKRIQEMHRGFGGAVFVVLRDGTKLTMSRRYRTRIREVTGLEV